MKRKGDLPRHLPVQLPRPLFGLAGLPRLLAAGRGRRAYQIYSPRLFPYPVLFLLRRPVVFALTGRAPERPRAVRWMRRLAAITVADEESLRRLRDAGLGNSRAVRSGVDAERFAARPLPLAGELRLLLASAPWTAEQFASKGIDPLLAAVASDPRLHLTLLWRGVLSAEIERRVDCLGLGDRVVVIDRLSDVDALLGGVHATVALATRGDLVKAYPHSLMESLVAGKPVLVSQAIPMADYVAKEGVGVVVEALTGDGILAATRQLRECYESCAARARARGRADFSLEGVLSSFGAVYDEVAPLARPRA